MDGLIPIIIVGAVLVGILVILSFALSLGGGSKKGKAQWKSQSLIRLNQITSNIAAGNSQSLKFAVMELDKLLDYVLQQMRLPGNTLGERLKSGAKYFPTRELYNQAWNSHKVRNQIAHEVSYDPHPDYLMTTVRGFREVLEALCD